MQLVAIVLNNSVIDIGDKVVNKSDKDLQSYGIYILVKDTGKKEAKNGTIYIEMKIQVMISAMQEIMQVKEIVDAAGGDVF